MRCKGAGYEGTNTLKIQDDTVVYDVVNGQLKPRRVTELSEIAELTGKVCPQQSTNLLCTLPAFMTITAGQSAGLEGTFPNAPKTARALAAFKSVNSKMTMKEVVIRCGRPDEVGGSGISIFIYHLDDGSLVAIGSADMNRPVFYANHISSTGKTTVLFSSQ